MKYAGTIYEWTGPPPIWVPVDRILSGRDGASALSNILKRETQKQNLPRFLPLDSYLEGGVQVRAAQAPPPLSSDTYRESGRIEQSELEQKTQQSELEQKTQRSELEQKTGLRGLEPEPETELKERRQIDRTGGDRPHDPRAGHDSDSHPSPWPTPNPPRKATSRATPPWLTRSDFESENPPTPPKQPKLQLPEFRPTSHSSFQTVSQTATEPKARKEKRTGNLIRLTSRILVVAALLSGIVASAYVYDYVSKIEAGLPVLPVSPALREPVSSIILAADGSEIARLYKVRRQWITLEEMSPNVVDALIATEDHRFFQHAGVDYFRLVGAAWNTLTGKLQGASTIPMQMARNAFPDVASSSAIDRKIKEIILARRLESRFSKEEILEWYLNTVSFGNNSFGIEAAAVTYFSKHAAELQLEEAALLVGMLKGPSRYNPRRHGSLSRERRNLVLQRMEETGKISLASFRRAASSPLLLNLTFYNPADSPAPFFTEYVRRVAQNWALRNGYDLYRDGLIIHTTLDADLQKLAELAVRSQMEILQRIVNSEWSQRRIPVTTGSTISASPFQYFWSTHRILESELIKKSTRYRRALERGVQATVALAELLGNPSFIDSLQTAASRLDAGLVAIDPHTGQIRAWVGGRDFSIDQYDKVASARRQPGSTFKPFLYAAAIEKGFSPYYLVEDRVRTFRTGPRGEVWRPTNAGGGASGRLVSLRQGLAWSKNTVSAHLIRRIGPRSVVRLAKNMGITSPLLPVPSLALGTSEVSLLELTNAYATLSNNGIKRNPTVITHIEDRTGKMIASFPSEPVRALSAQTAYTVLDILRDVVQPGGTGNFIRTRFGLKGDLAGKTGTTQNNADGWFILMHPNLVVGSWVGFNDQRFVFRSNYWGQGGHNALLLAGDFVKQAISLRESPLALAEFVPPPGYRPPKKPVRKVDEEKPEVKPDLPRLPLERMTPRNSYLPLAKKATPVILKSSR